MLGQLESHYNVAQEPQKFSSLFSKMLESGAFSERQFQVVSITYEVSRDCQTTCKYVVDGGERVEETGDRCFL
jgi:hypothetical protein